MKCEEEWDDCFDITIGSLWNGCIFLVLGLKLSLHYLIVLLDSLL